MSLFCRNFHSNWLSLGFNSSMTYLEDICRFLYSQEESALALTVWVPLVWMAFFTLGYSPKERFLKEPLRGVPFVWLLSFLYLIVFWKFYPPTKQTFSTSYSPKERFLKEPLRGVPFVWVLSFLYLIVLENFYPPTKHEIFCLIVRVAMVVVVGRIYLWNFLDV